MEGEAVFEAPGKPGLASPAPSVGGPGGTAGVTEVGSVMGAKGGEVPAPCGSKVPEWVSRKDVQRNSGESGMGAKGPQFPPKCASFSRNRQVQAGLVEPSREAKWGNLVSNSGFLDFRSRMARSGIQTSVGIGDKNGTGNGQAVSGLLGRANGKAPNGHIGGMALRGLGGQIMVCRVGPRGR